MRKQLGFIVGICALLFAVTRPSSGTLASFTGSGSASHQPAQKTSGESALNERIARIENGLLPQVLIKGQPIPKMTMAERMKFYKVPGVSIAFFENGKIAWTRTYGVADVTTKRPVTPETLFQAASISKPTSALATLKLVQEGKLSLDEDVNVKLRDWKVPENEFTKDKKVTLRGILSHTAGLNVHGFPGYASDEPLPTVLQILNGEKPAVNPPVRVDTLPGTRWSYSGGGYVIMQELLIETTGKPYPQIMHDLVLQPAGMTHSTFQQPLPKSLSSSAATPYRSDGQPVKGGAHTYPEMAPAGLWTTPSDLARMGIEVQKEYAGKSSKILSQDMMHQMLTRQKDDQGLGFKVEAPGHELHFGHGGSNEGFKSQFEAYTDSQSDQGYAIMINSDSAEIMSEIARAIATEYNWPDFHPKEHTQIPMDPKVFDAYVGRYQLDQETILTASRDGGHFFLQRNHAEKEEVFPESNRDFFSMDGVSLSFAGDDPGHAAELILHSRGMEQHAKRIEK